DLGGRDGECDGVHRLAGRIGGGQRGDTRVGYAFIAQQCYERVFDFAGLVALQGKRAMEERNARFEEAEQFVVVPPDEVDETHGKRLIGGGRRKFDGQRGVVDGVAEVGEGAAVAELLERGLDVVSGEREALLQAGDAEKFGGVEVLRRVRRYKANGLRVVRLCRDWARQYAGENQDDNG